MFIQSTFRVAGGLGRHLLEGRGNEQIVVRYDLFREAPTDPVLALRYFAALTDASPQTKRHFFQAIISPEVALEPIQVARICAAIEAEFGVQPGHPMIAVEHWKGDRPAHLHLVYPIVHPSSGRAIKSHENRVKDHIVARTMELEFGHPIVPAQKPDLNDIVLNRLEQRDIDVARFRDALENTAGPPTALRIAKADLQQASRLKVDAKKIASCVCACWDRAPDLRLFKTMIEANGFALAAGNKTVQLIEPDAGGAFDLARVLRADASREKRKRRIKQADLAAAFGPLESVDDVRDRLLAKALAAAQKETGFERKMLAAETRLDQSVDGMALDGPLPAPINLQPLTKTTLKVRREAIFAEQRERDALRRHRVDRAFKFAQWFDCPAAKKVAFMAAVLGVTLAGGGLTLAVVAGCVAVTQVPTRERARGLAMLAKLQRQADWAATRARLDDLRRTVEQSSMFPEEMRTLARSSTIDELLATLKPPDGKDGKGAGAAQPETEGVCKKKERSSLETSLARSRSDGYER
jgi:hypothetical protein